MKRSKFSPLVLVLSVMVLTSCSGLPQPATGGGAVGGTGTANLTITMISQGQTLGQGFAILSFSANITSLTLNVAGGNAMSLSLSPSVSPVDFNRIQTDTALLGTFSVPADTTFSSLTMALSNIQI